MAKKKNKTRKILITLGVLVVLGGLAAFAFLRKKEQIVTVQTEKVGRRSLTELVMATGKIQPVVFVKISPEVSGEIIELPVKEGQKVKKGDLLLKIKPDTYLAGKNIAAANCKASQAQNIMSKANLDRAESELRRSTDLFKNNLVSESQYIDAKTSYDVAKASYESSCHQTDNAKANLARAEEDLAKTIITSPLDGTISKLGSQLGERVVGTATYQGTEVMTISDLNTMEARVDIGEIDVVLIALGQKTRLEVDSFRDKKFTGFVSDIANTAKTSGAGSQQEATKFEVRIRIQEKESFRPGMSVTAEVETRYRTNVLSVPIQSVTTRMPKGDKPSDKANTSGAQTNMAASSKTNATDSASKTNETAGAVSTNSMHSGRKANEAPKPIEVAFLADGDKAKMVPVTRGISDDAYVEITSGLTEGQDVISGGYKAINKELDDAKKIKVDNNKKDFSKDAKKEEGGK